IPNDSDKIKEIGGYVYPMLIGPKWCAINVSMFGSGGATPSLIQLFPGFMSMAEDWWPSPYDIPGPKIDIYYPITRMGIWGAGADRITGNWNFTITKYAGHRYRIRVGDQNSVLKVTVTTSDPSDLLVFLVDPKGHLRAPDIPQWNGPIMPIHWWNGFHNETGYSRWRTWDPEPHTEFSAEVLHPEKGIWTAIVVPRNADGQKNIRYTITGTIRKLNPSRVNAAISAANAAVIASLKHIPLLYVKENSVPDATENALDTLGVSHVIFVENNNIGKKVRDQLPTLEADLKNMQEIIDYIKDHEASENYITITSLATGDGYFAPASMLAAYHGSPVLHIDDAPDNPAGVADRIETWRLWDGDYYHGSRSCGNLPVHDEPLPGTIKMIIDIIRYFMSNGEQGALPPLGLDAKKTWNEELYNGIHNWIKNYGLDREGQEGYCFVAPRKDIYIPAHSVMMGNNSYAGHIPGITPAYTSDIVVRNIMYPALIFANPNRDITTTQFMNFPDGGMWRTNDGKTHSVYSSRVVKKAFMSHGRKYDGHCLWLAHLQRMNDGASVMYYSGHGTGGSGISAQYLQTNHCNYPDQIWWDAWRGYMYDNWRTARDNGMRWYNAEPPNLYDIIHFTYVDQLMENLRSNAIFYMSCTTADAFGPMVYLDHGAVMFYGNAGSGLCPEADLQDDEFFTDAMINGIPVGPAYSKQVWLHYRDFTTGDPTSMYGSSSMQVTTVQCIYGDPNLIIYSPEWESPVPVDP
ncbi:MAG: hypothetical protein DRN05_01570, partial [Thermoplasmata archaeon]